MSKYISTSILFSAMLVSAVDAKAEASIELVSGLTECAGQIDAATVYPGAIDGLSSLKASSLGALSYLTNDRIGAERRAIMSAARDDFADKLAREPMNARTLMIDIRTKCTNYIYQAEDVRTDDVQKANDEAAAKAKADADRHEKELEATRVAALEANRAAAIELARINAETERLKILKQAELESEKSKIELEGRKIDATTNVDLSKIDAETERYKVDKAATVASERTKAGVEVARIKADTGVAITGKLAEVAIASEAAATERTKVEATAATDIAKSNSQAAETIVSIAAEAEIEKQKAAVEISKNKTHNDERLVDTAFASSSIRASDPLASEEIYRAAECGAFYRVLAEKAPQNQKPSISRISTNLFDHARKIGATDEVLSEAPTALERKLKQQATLGKQAFQKEVVDMKERCTTLAANI